MKWINLNDEMPPDFLEVLLFGIVDGVKKDILTAYRDDKGIWYNTYLVYGTSAINEKTWVPKYWMQLPDYPDIESCIHENDGETYCKDFPAWDGCVDYKCKHCGEFYR